MNHPSPDARAQLIRRVCLSPQISSADIDAINAAFDAQAAHVEQQEQVKQVLVYLLKPMPKPDPGVRFEVHALAVQQRTAHNARIHVAAATLGIDLNDSK